MDAETLLKELATVGQQIRVWQQTYFKTRAPSALNKAKELERAFDRLLSQYFGATHAPANEQTKLFE